MKTFTTPKGTTLPLLDMRGKDYLQVAQRLVWFREEKPEWRITTSFVELTNDWAIARAEILDVHNQVVATAHKREDRGHFGDFLEKAETGAIGRALAYCGFGTAFCADELDEGARIVDAPQDPKKPEIKSIKSVKMTTSSNPTVSQSKPAISPASSDWESFNNKKDPAPQVNLREIEYRIPFGRKTKGKTLEEVGVQELANCVITLQNDFAEKNKPITGQYAEFIAQAESFIKTVRGASSS